MRAQLSRQARGYSTAGPALGVGTVNMPPARRVVECDGEPLQLTPIKCVHIANLRKKVATDPSMPRQLLTEARIDYRPRA